MLAMLSLSGAIHSTAVLNTSKVLHELEHPIGKQLLYLAHMTGNQSGAEKDNRLLFREQ